jgi:hypothetical protein
MAWVLVPWRLLGLQGISPRYGEEDHLREADGKVNQVIFIQVLHQWCFIKILQH